MNEFQPSPTKLDKYTGMLHRYIISYDALQFYIFVINKCEVWCVKSDVWSLWSLMCEVCEVWSVKSVWSLWSLICEVHVKSDLWSLWSQNCEVCVKSVKSDRWSLWSLTPRLTPHSDTWSGDQALMSPSLSPSHSWLKKQVLTIVSSWTVIVWGCCCLCLLNLCGHHITVCWRSLCMVPGGFFPQFVTSVCLSFHWGQGKAGWEE